ncbi:MAG: NAD(P)H-binding protein [Candidatus Omnitrophica bacterium]|nr:NAD(P)H-binding protein [Candidatus Omnitrophota bacterium]
MAGATGLLGRPVAQRLLSDGFEVRVLARDPAKARRFFSQQYEVVAGDVEDPASLVQAMTGCEGLHISLAGYGPEMTYRIEHLGTANLVEAAVANGLRRITYLSGATVCAQNRWYPNINAKLKAEAAIEASGIPFTIFRATWFMESLPKFVQGNRALIPGAQAHPRHWVAAGDYARMLSRAYGTAAVANKRLYVFGPQAHTMFEAVSQYCRWLRPDIKTMHVPLWLGEVRAFAKQDSLLRAQIATMRYFNQSPEQGNPAEANALLGVPEINLEQWCRTYGSQKREESVEYQT